MKKILLAISLIFVMGIFFTNTVQAQNTFPATGSAGIGTTTPSQPLHIYSSGTELNDGANIMLEGNYASTDKNIGVILIKNANTQDLFYCGLRTWSNGQREFIQSGYDAATNTWGEFMYFNYGTKKYEVRDGVGHSEFLNSGNVLFNNTGNVGIGVTTIPEGVKFAVNGKVNCKEVEVTLSGWSDKVFNKDYSLMPLSKVEDFINANNHLPGVPSEAEVLSKPANLGEMDALLLQKVEELTLYMIQLKKENDQLKERIIKLER